MILINKHDLLDEILLLASKQNTVTVKEIYTLIQKQESIKVIYVRR